MRFAIFGLTVSSSWGNGHATFWRGLISALAKGGHEICFFERDLPYYAQHRDVEVLPHGAELILYPDWDSVRQVAKERVARADVAIVTSYCPDGAIASALVLDHAGGQSVFYDLDTPVTLARLEEGQHPAYLPPHGLGDFDLVLSYTGGEALARLKSRLGAVRVATLYGHVDPELHRPAPRQDAFSGDLSYMGTYAADRQEALERLFVEPARRCPERRFVLGGSGYPEDFPWTSNIAFVRHLPPADHPAFFCSSRLTLNVTRADMAALGYCPSGRLFEAAACGAPVLSVWWEGLDSFFEPGREILIARTSEDAIEAIGRSGADLVRIAQAARARVLEEHSSAHRARELVALLRDPPAAPRAAFETEPLAAGA